MRRKRRVILLLVAILLPSAALAAFGVLAVIRDAEEAETEVRSRAEAAAEAARAALLATRDPGVAPEAVRFRTDADGRLLDPASPPRPEASATDEAEAALWLHLARETDAAVREGREEEARAALRGFIDRAGASPVAAAALTALGALDRRAGRIEDARAAWQRLVDEHPLARDARGLRRAFAARFLLAEGEEDAAARLLDLYDDVAEDHRSAADSATASFLETVRARLRPMLAGDPTAAARAEETSIRHAAGRSLRALRAAFDLRLSAWIAGGAAVAFVTVDVPIEVGDRGDSERWLATAESDADGGFTGAAAPAHLVAAAVFARPALSAWSDFGFGFRLERAAAPPPPDPAIARRDLDGPWSGHRILVTGETLEAARARARRSVLWIAALAAAGIAVAVIAAVATVRAVDREMAAAAARESFVAAVTHELKAPLASIRLLSELLARGGVEEEKVREFGARTVGEADRLTRLVAQILELARIENAGPRPERHRRLDLLALARDVVASFAPQAGARGFTVRVGTDAERVGAAGPPPAVIGDQDALGGALLNLLDNALKYSDAPHEILVEVGPAAGGMAVLAVLDRGRGVPAGEAARIFEPFARGGDELTRDRPGVGLGLALVRGVALSHGGRAEYEPREGGGSVFRIVLPAAS